MSSKAIEIKTSHGVAPCHLFPAPQSQPRPAVIMYMDAFGIRPALISMAQRLASDGYHVLLPNLYYRTGPVSPVEPASAAKEGPQRDRLMSIFKSLNNNLVMSDTGAILDYLEAQLLIVRGKIGCVGYCMGGAFALSAAGTYPGRVAAAASIHGGRLATDQPDSPHLLAPKMKAAIYVGIAGIDPHFPLEEKERLEASLQSAHVKHTVEVYDGVKHGFAVTDHPAYDRNASELYWQRILKLFAENLAIC